MPGMLAPCPNRFAQSALSKDFSGDNNNWIEIDLSIPLEISYVFHADKYFAFQTGLIIDLPVLYHCHNEGYYLPVFSGFIGFRI